MNVPNECDEPTDDSDEYEMETECPYCDGDGLQHGEDFSYDCPECGGTGWQ